MNKKLPTWVTIPAVCVASALMLNGVNGATRAKIDRHASMADDLARAKLVNAEKFEPLELQDSRYSVDEVYAALNGSGETVGYVGKTTVTGYGGPVEVTAGVDGAGVITGVDVGGEGFNETPGLGGLTREPKFVSQFKGKAAGVKLNEGEDTDGVDGVAGATISSRAVLGGVNNIASYVASAELGILEEAEEAYMGPTVSASAKGFAGDVTVTAGLDDAGAVAYLAVETPDETEGLGKLASEPEFTRQFIGKTGPFTYGEDGIEAVSGASFTSNAVLEALNTIVAGGGEASEGPLSKTVQGFGGDVTVNVMLNGDNSVAALTVDTPNETEGLGKRASEPEFTNQFIGKTAPFAYGEDGIEAITGASVTSGAVLDALNELVPAGEKAPSEAPDESGEAVPASAETEVPAETEAPAEPEAPVEAESAVETEAPAPVRGTLENMFRQRPVDSALTGAAATQAGGVERMFRARPADAALANAAVTAAAPAESGADRLMRAKPADTAFAAAEVPAEAEEAPVETEAAAPAGDADRLMRAKPADTAFAAAEAPAEAAVEAPAETEAAAPAETEAEAPAEAVEAPAETEAAAPAEAEAAEPAATGDASGMFRARPADAALEAASSALSLQADVAGLSGEIAEAVNVGDAVRASLGLSDEPVPAEYDKYMRPRPVFKGGQA